MKSGSHNHNEIVVQNPAGASATAASSKPCPRDIEAAASPSAGPIGCNHNQIGVLNHNHISVRGA
ncbi:hypothetical protein ACK389_15545 [Streptomyces antibioticus]|uniref:Uncharacterized protein n=1 Tax=Streptomyces antibioticus TaxID=1890 RepID=A0AAE6YCI0_STRAT|nr:hypothetical protein [Streptomyces antibioticus]MBO7934629.1 hypothetical protein [Streptomyces sp. S9]MCX5172321.1 hypothetical protein [Streptomyces antibioticus]OOQ47066.1 hypothetical protein AFM16_30255 [Streptomyces antibioticus]QIT47373.1 hypothetical protein HCX60_30790 [Streptomyces antibioticus]